MPALPLPFIPPVFLLSHLQGLFVSLPQSTATTTARKGPPIDGPIKSLTQHSLMLAHPAPEPPLIANQNYMEHQKFFFLTTRYSLVVIKLTPLDILRQLLPILPFAVPTDRAYNVTTTGTPDGRIFMGAKDGCIYEFFYQVNNNNKILLLKCWNLNYVYFLG